jgi:succinate dehydrogenase / fumarate reductase cytochrome b subunit
MVRTSTFYGTSVGKKTVVAATGALLVLFLVGHMLGNLLAWEGAGHGGGDAKLNGYARLLRVEPVFLWGIRLGLLAVFVIHVWTTVRLVLENRRARGVAYAVRKRQASTLASRTMIYGGIAVALFVVYHLLHLTTGHAHPALMERHGHEDVYARVVSSFQVPAITLIYLGALSFLFLHLTHGIQSVFETLGVTHPGTLAFVRRGSVVFALILILGFASVPLGVWAGLIR